MKVRAMIKLIEDDGWRQVAQRGGHRQFKHQTKPGRVTVAPASSPMSCTQDPSKHHHPSPVE